MRAVAEAAAWGRTFTFVLYRGGERHEGSGPQPPVERRSFKPPPCQKRFRRARSSESVVGWCQNCQLARMRQPANQ